MRSALITSGVILLLTVVINVLYSMFGEQLVALSYQDDTVSTMGKVIGAKLKHGPEQYAAMLGWSLKKINLLLLIAAILPIAHVYLLQRLSTGRGEISSTIDSGANRIWSLPLSCFYYLAITVFYFASYLPELNTALIGPAADNMQDFWNTWYFQKKLDQGLSDFYSTELLYYPEQISLLFHSFSYSNLFLIYLIRKVLFLSADTQILLILHNVTLILSCFLGALGGYLLIFQISSSRIGAFVGGFIIGFSPFHFTQVTHHTHMAVFQFVPFFVLFYLRVVQKPRWYLYAGCICFYVLGALSSWYYLVYNLYFIVFYYLWSAVKARQIIQKNLILSNCIIVATTVLLLSPIIGPMALSGTSGSQGYVEGHDFFVIDLAGFVLFHAYHPLNSLVQAVTRDFSGFPWENAAYLGIVNLGLITWFLYRKPQGYSETVSFALWGGAFFAIWSFGVSLHVFGINTLIPMPTALSEHIPLFNLVRTSSRAALYVYIFLGMLTAIAIRELIRSGCKLPLVYLFIGFIILDYYPVDGKMTPVKLPQAYAQIASDPDTGFAVLDLPEGQQQQKRNMLYQTMHEKPIVNGKVSRKLSPTLIDELDYIDLRSQQKQLISSNVKYIVMHKKRLRLFRKINIDHYRKTYREIFSDKKHSVFKVY